MVIYFIREGLEGNIKIGYTTDNILKRKSVLQTGNSKELIIIGTMDGNQGLEAYLNHKFRKFRLKGEWFSPKKELLEYIDKNVQFHQDYVFYLREKLKEKNKTLENLLSDDAQKKANSKPQPFYKKSTEYYSELAKVNLPAIQMQIIMTIIKCTWGNDPRQEKAVITTKEFLYEIEDINITEKILKELIGDLLNKKMIIKTVKIPPTYLIQEDYKKWINIQAALL